MRVITDSGLTSNLYEKNGHAFNFSTSTGWVKMKTTSSEGATNEKHYTLFYEPLNLQWYGCETSNALDNIKQYSYTLDNNNRFLYTGISRYPLGGSTPSDTSTFEYDNLANHNNLISATDPYGNETEYIYAANKLDQICTIDPRGIITSNYYDNCGNLLKTIEDCNGINRTSSNLYNEAGQVIKSFDPLLVIITSLTAYHNHRAVIILLMILIQIISAILSQRVILSIELQLLLMMISEEKLLSTLLATRLPHDTLRGIITT